MTYSGMRLLRARRLWRQCGGVVEDRKGTGEEVYSHPALHRAIAVNKRRHDAPRTLTAALRKLA